MCIRDRDQTVLHILKTDGTLALFVEVLILQILVDLVDEGRADGVLKLRTDLTDDERTALELSLIHISTTIRYPSSRCVSSWKRNIPLPPCLLMKMCIRDRT